MRQRGFEIVSKYQDASINLPIRSTKHAAGYDFEAAEEVVLPAIWKEIWNHLKSGAHDESVIKPRLVPTGIKAYMGNDEYLQLTNRSSNPLKRFLILPNGVGIVDADYYNNEGNEGEIFFQLINYGVTDQVIRKGERIGQGIFLPFLKADQDNTTDATRAGGFGSSGK